MPDPPPDAPGEGDKKEIKSVLEYSWPLRSQKALKGMTHKGIFLESPIVDKNRPKPVRNQSRDVGQRPDSSVKRRAPLDETLFHGCVFSGPRAFSCRYLFFGSTAAFVAHLQFWAVWGGNVGGLLVSFGSVFRKKNWPETYVFIY